MQGTDYTRDEGQRGDNKVIQRSAAAQSYYHYWAGNFSGAQAEGSTTRVWNYGTCSQGETRLP